MARPRLQVSVICSGNICRSPIGEHLLRDAVRKAGLDDRVEVSSAGTGPWHVGQPAHERSRRALARAGYPHHHVAHQIDASELAGIDLVLAADRGHLEFLRRMTDDPDKVRLLRSFDPDADGDEVPDPYYGPDSEFDAVLVMISAAVPGIVGEIRRRLE